MSNRIVIFNGMSNNLETLTDWFIQGDYFFMEAFNIGNGELECNAFLNVEIEEVIRVIPILRLVDGVTTNVIDTELIFAIPNQFRESYRKRLALLIGEEIRIKITLIQEETACDRTEIGVQVIQESNSVLLDKVNEGLGALRTLVTESLQNSGYNRSFDGKLNSLLETATLLQEFTETSLLNDQDLEILITRMYTELVYYSLANISLNGYNSILNLQQNAALASFAIGIGAAIPSGGLSLTALPAIILPILNPVPIPALPGSLPIGLLP